MAEKNRTLNASFLPGYAAADGVRVSFPDIEQAAAAIPLRIALSRLL